MDLEKLEKLSCLKISEEMKPSMQKSLDGIFSLMSTVENMTVSELSENQLSDSVFIQRQSDMIAKSYESESIHLKEGYFISPQIIKKD